jgi:hypothetical protein
MKLERFKKNNKKTQKFLILLGIILILGGEAVRELRSFQASYENLIY